MASASYDQALSSASISRPTEHDVFISFRGLDTRYIFTDYLYDALLRAGIQTFKDDHEIHGGESISNALVQAIHGSKLYIIVLSENYASSTWCLDELVEMITFSQSKFRRIVPVFYNIEPVAVKKQTGSFKEAFRKHGTRFDMDRLDMWRYALKEVTEFSGYLVPKNMSQAYIIRKVVDEVSQQINPPLLYGMHRAYKDKPEAKWGVFLSCADTRCAFHGNLFNALHRRGVQIFEDDPELHSKEGPLSVTLIEVIQESEIYVVVLSDKYASSERCLNELIKIFEYCNLTGRSILPVFYNIEPAMVRYQIGNFKKALQEHEFRYGKILSNKLRVALTNVGSLSGYQVHKNMSQIDIINKVVDRVLLKKNSIANDPVGLNSRVKGISTFLSNVTKHVIRFGIHGIGDGKTTLAKALFKQLWPGSFKRGCYLDNKLMTATTERLLSLQKYLLAQALVTSNGIEIENVDQGIEVIRARMSSMKLLLVIDGVEDRRIVDCLVGTFAMGSIVIITTENEDILDSLKVEAKYKVNGPGEAESRQLYWNL